MLKKLVFIAIMLSLYASLNTVTQSNLRGQSQKLEADVRRPKGKTKAPKAKAPEPKEKYLGDQFAHEDECEELAVQEIENDKFAESYRYEEA